MAEARTVTATPLRRDPIVKPRPRYFPAPLPSEPPSTDIPAAFVMVVLILLALFFLWLCINPLVIVLRRRRQRAALEKALQQNKAQRVNPKDFNSLQVIEYSVLQNQLLVTNTELKRAQWAARQLTDRVRQLESELRAKNEKCDRIVAELKTEKQCFIQFDKKVSDLRGEFDGVYKELEQAKKELELERETHKGAVKKLKDGFKKEKKIWDETLEEVSATYERKEKEIESLKREVEVLQAAKATAGGRVVITHAKTQQPARLTAIERVKRISEAQPKHLVVSGSPCVTFSAAMSEASGVVTVTSPSSGTTYTADQLQTRLHKERFHLKCELDKLKKRLQLQTDKFELLEKHYVTELDSLSRKLIEAKHDKLAIESHLIQLQKLKSPDRVKELERTGEGLKSDLELRMVEAKLLEDQIEELKIMGKEKDNRIKQLEDKCKSFLSPGIPWSRERSRRTPSPPSKYGSDLRQQAAFTAESRIEGHIAETPSTPSRAREDN